MKTRLVLLALACLLVAAPATAQVNYAVSGNTAYVTSSPNASGAIVINSAYEGKTVTSIGDYAFSGCTNLTSVSIPNSVISIGQQAFGNCTALTSVTIPGSVTRIGTTLNSAGNAGAFVNCTSLTNVIIGNSVTNIGGAAFFGCTNLTRVTIPASVTDIGAWAFGQCSGLTICTFLGNAPRLFFDMEGGGGHFVGVAAGAKVYYSCGTTGWGATYGGLPTVMLCAPFVTTLAADQLTNTSARLRGQVNPRGSGSPTAAWFEWGTATNYGNVIGMQDVGQDSSVSNLNVVLDGLVGGPTYHYRLVATNAFGVVYGADQTFGLSFIPIPIPGLPTVGSGGSAAWGDYDNDGRLDFVLSGCCLGIGVGSQLWRNTGTGFSNVTDSVAPGLPRVYQGAVAWGDYDNDGRLDLLLAGSDVSQLWRNTGSAFSNVTASVAPGLPGIYAGSVAWGDFDNDGRLDFWMTGGGAQLWRNTGSGFSNVTASVAPGLPDAFRGSWGDYDNDGRLDLLLVGGGAGTQLWRNTGSGFSNVTASVLPGSYGYFVAWGDYDNDGRLDFLLTGSGTIQLWRNTGAGFSNVTASVAPGLQGVYESSVAWGDYDNDGRLDFLLTGTPDPEGFPARQISQLWRNTVAGFSNVTASVAPGLPGSASPVAWGDFDNDGRLDFLLTGRGQLWRNNMPVASNASPAAPTGLSSTLSGATVSLSWNPPADDRTPSTGLNYNLRIGTTPGASDVLAPMALTDGLRLLPALGNAQAGTNAVMNLPFGRYYWSVQAVDTSFAGSPFVVEQQFTIASRIIELLMLSNGHFQFSFTNQSSAVYEVLGTTNVALPLAQWTVLGPPVSLGGGLYQFTDLLATNHAQRFYLLRQQ